MPSVNYTTGLNFSFFNPTQVAIASDDATVSDADEDSIIEVINVDLAPGQSGDRIVLGFGCSDNEEETICHLKPR